MAVQALESTTLEKIRKAERREVVMIFMGICSVIRRTELGRYDRNESKGSMPMVLVT
jgi:hypothetical protein